MGSSPKTTATNGKAYWQKKIEECQRSINQLKDQNVRDRETSKNNNSKRGSKTAGDAAKAHIAQRKKSIENLQQLLAEYKRCKANCSK